MNKQQLMRDLSITEQNINTFDNNYNHTAESKNLVNNYKREINILKQNISRFTEEYIMSEVMQDKLCNIILNMKLLSEKITSIYKQTSNI